MKNTFQYIVTMFNCLSGKCLSEKFNNYKKYVDVNDVNRLFLQTIYNLFWR